MVADCFRSDEELVLRAAAQRHAAMRHASAALLGDRSFILKAVRQEGELLHHAADALHDDRDIVLTAFAQNVRAFALARGQWGGDLAEEAATLRSAMLRVKMNPNSRDVVLRATLQHPLAWQFASEDFQWSDEFCAQSRTAEPVVGAPWTNPGVLTAGILA